jgi:hypothetical protein
VKRYVSKQHISIASIHKQEAYKYDNYVKKPTLHSQFFASPLRQPHQFFEFENFQKPRGGCYKKSKNPEDWIKPIGYLSWEKNQEV